MIDNASWLGSIEWHITPKVDIFGYVGGEYAGRAAYTGYQSVTGSTTTIPVTLTGTPARGTPVSIIYPETQTKWTTSTSGFGGYG